MEKTWADVDMQNSNELTKNTLYQLLKKLNISPQITHDEVEKLWGDFILKDNGKLEYWQFIRQIGYSKKSAAFENAKRAPPTRGMFFNFFFFIIFGSIENQFEFFILGDGDVLLTSKKLSSEKVIVRETVLHKLGYLYESLRKNFVELDPHFTNYVLKEEFEEVLLEICPDLKQNEMEYLSAKFEHPQGGKYVKLKEMNVI